MNVEEARRRMPAARLIDDGEVRRGVLVEITEFPDYFWHAPATSSENYHNRFARGERGLWIHVLMAATAFEHASDSYAAQGRLTDYEVDLGRAAILLHDGRKYGRGWRTGDSAAQDHDLMMADRIRTATDLPGRVADAVAAHMGPWYAGPAPTTALERAVHLADMSAAARHGTWAVYHPPEELIDAQPELPRVGFDDTDPVTDSAQRGLGSFSGGESS